MPILRRLRRAIRARLPHAALVRAHARALLAGRRLPPGSLVGWDVLERSDRRVLLRHAATFGPIFKAVAYDLYWVCIVDLRLGRQLLREHADSLQGMTLNLEPFVPSGFLRQMQGETHRKYRRAVMHAVVEADLSVHRPVLEAIAHGAMSQYADSRAFDGSSSTAWISTLNTIATGMLIVIFFGAVPGSKVYDQLVEGFHTLGPRGLVWRIGDRERRAFETIKSVLRAYCAEVESLNAQGAPTSVLERMRRDGSLDETLLGNLIYMVEMGRYDTRGLFRWLSKYAAERPDLLDRIAAEGERPAGTRTLAEAFVMETLRMDQSERLMRIVQRDIVFEGYFIPRDSRVRVCLWESHKSDEAFPEAFRFHPERFQGQPLHGDQYAPFGLDHHQCPFGGVAMQTAITFLRTLAHGFTPTAMHDGEPIRGEYVWEPAAEFSVRLKRRSNA